jgi:cyanophycinase
MLFVFLFIHFCNGNAQEQWTTGPENGHLIIAGGGGLSDEVLGKFVELAGGENAHIVVIPTAGGRDTYGQDYGRSKNFRELGAKSVTIIHTNDKKEADTEAFIAPLKEAKGVWFSGGRQWRLVDSYQGTKTEEMIRKVLDKGGVIGGSSAGATIQGSFLARGDSKSNQIMAGDHLEGFAYIKNVAIDQHVIARNRQFDMFTILKEYPHLLGLSVDEGTAMWVTGDQFKVIGDSYVIVYDGTFYSSEGFITKELPPPSSSFYFLKNGDKYNLKERTVIKN